MYRSCNDCVFSCDIDNNGVDSWLKHPSGQLDWLRLRAVSVCQAAPKGVISESRGGCGSVL